MYVRLGFAVAVHTDPEVLLVDEVLSVGDEAFSHRCLRRIEEMLAERRTLLFVSHDLDLVAGLCDRALWLDGGRPREVGEPRRVIDAYRQAVAEAEGEEHRREKDARAEEAATEDGGEAGAPGTRRWGSRQAVINALRLRGAGGEERYTFASGEPVTFEIEAAPREPLADFVFGVGVFTPRGVECWGTNSEIAGYRPRRFDRPVTVRVVCPALHLAAGEYLLDAAIHSRDGAPYDYRSRALAFTVTSRRRSAGIYLPEHRWEAEGGVEWSPPEE
jgi:hypothetical protein